MEKQEAIHYILSEIEKGHSEDEIVVELSRQLGAPHEIVAGFVSRTIASQDAMKLVSPRTEHPGPASDAPDEQVQDSSMMAETGENQDASNVRFSEGVTPAGNEFGGEGDLPDAGEPVEEIIMGEPSEWVEEAYPLDESPPVALEEQADDSLPTAEIQAKEAEELVEDSVQQETAQSPAPVWDPDALAKKAAEPLSPGDRARLEKAILAALSKQRRQSDIVMMVCERTGMSWDQSQRLVAEVNMKNRNKLNRREGTIQILLSLLAMLAGLALIFLVLSEAYTYYRLYAQPQTPSLVIPVLDRYTIWGGMVGALLFLGGITGIVLGIRKVQD